MTHPLHQLTCDCKSIAAYRPLTDDNREAFHGLSSRSRERWPGFGPFVLSFRRRQLFRDAQLIRLGARALSTLIALVERHGAVVSKTALQRIVWPNTHVDEGTFVYKSAPCVASSKTASRSRDTFRRAREKAIYLSVNLAACLLNWSRLPEQNFCVATLRDIFPAPLAGQTAPASSSVWESSRFAWDELSDQHGIPYSEE